MSKHTPGPWEVANGSAFSNACYAGISAENHDYLAEVVIRMDDDALPSLGLIANARLIAAAPDLLAALQAVWSEGVIPDGFALLQDQVCDAIAKATGEQA